MARKHLMYWPEVSEYTRALVDSILVGFMDDMVEDVTIMPSSFAERSAAAITLAKRIKEKLAEEDVKDAQDDAG